MRKSIYAEADFWLASLERALKTFTQTAAAIIVADGTDLLNTGWVGVLSVSGMACLVSVLTSIASAQVAGDGPSLATETTDPVPPEYPSDAPAVALAHRNDGVYGPATTEAILHPKMDDSKHDAAYHGRD